MEKSKFPTDVITSDDQKKVMKLANEIYDILDKYDNSGFGSSISGIKGLASRIEKQILSLKTQD